MLKHFNGSHPKATVQVHPDNKTVVVTHGSLPELTIQD